MEDLCISCTAHFRAHIWKIWSCEGVGEPSARRGAPKGLFDHILGNRGHLCEGVDKRKRQVTFHKQ